MSEFYNPNPILSQDPRLPAKLPHLIGAMNLSGPRGLCFHRAVGFVLDVGPPNPATLVIGRIREANDEEKAVLGPDASPTPFIHAWCEWRGELFAPTTIERAGGALFPIPRELYLNRNGAKVLATMTRGQIKALDREFGFSAHLRKFKPIRGGASFGAVLLERAGVAWKDNGLGGVEAID
jgi:hypothetical protein